MTQYGFHFDGTRCTAARRACWRKDKKDLSTDISFRKVYEYGGGSWTQDDAGAWTCDTYVYHVSVACNHCDSPACMAKCRRGYL